LEMQISNIKYQNYKLKSKNIFKNSGFWFIILIFAFCILNFIGCATAPLVSPPKPGYAVPGFYHRVERGQTLWRISKIYNIDLDEVVKINRISDAANIDTGQLIFIPLAGSSAKSQYLPAKSALEDFVWPIRGRVIATFGQTFNNMINKGINIQPYGAGDVVAVRSGRVVFYVDDFEGFGKTVIISHGDGISSVYARNSKVFIKVGDTVQKGSLISKVGQAGRDKNTYLHFQIRKGHIPQDPYFYLPR
jgi:murein DD-endopeptidase MepM/ murein hydrolase activator NlpD